VVVTMKERITNVLSPEFLYSPLELYVSENSYPTRYLFIFFYLILLFS
jgi:hypothetical protein